MIAFHQRLLQRGAPVTAATAPTLGTLEIPDASTGASLLDRTLPPDGNFPRTGNSSDEFFQLLESFVCHRSFTGAQACCTLDG